MLLKKDSKSFLCVYCLLIEISILIVETLKVKGNFGRFINHENFIVLILLLLQIT